MVGLPVPAHLRPQLVGRRCKLAGPTLRPTALAVRWRSLTVSCGKQGVPPNMKTVGVISDTHGLLRPEVFEVLKGVDLIVHAGDIGSPQIIDALRKLAPVSAIRGNVDRGMWAEEFSETEIVAIDNLHLYVLHDLGQLDLDPAAAGFRVVVYGHSHIPSVVEKQGVVYLNPGSAGPRRLRLPISVARMVVGDFDGQGGTQPFAFGSGARRIAVEVISLEK